MFSIRLRPQDLSLEPIAMDVFSFQEVLDYVKNNARDILEVSLMKDTETIIDFKVVYFDRINKWNLFYAGKNYMLPELDINIFMQILSSTLDENQKSELDSLNELSSSYS